MEPGTGPSLLFSASLLLTLLAAFNGELVCWQALLRCHEDRECELAYSQYLLACDANLRGTRRQCPSHCIGALVRLNQTSSGRDLETCDCGEDAECSRAKRAIEPCLPRTLPGIDGNGGEMGCTEARRRCEEASGCRWSLSRYLAHCGQLFNGRKCSSRCKATIEELLSTGDGARLDRCVCDGVERPFCEVVKDNMVRLCGVGDDRDGHYDEYEDEDYEQRDGDADADAGAVASRSDVSRFSAHVVLLFLGAVFVTLL